jgi:hypothetical protein
VADFDATCVVGRSEDRTSVSQQRLTVRIGNALDACDSEVEHFDEVGGTISRDEHDVLGLEIAMHDPLGVRRPHAKRDAACDLERPSRGYRSLVELTAKRSPLQILEDEKERAVREPPEIGRRRDIGVADRRRGHSLALETRDHLRRAEPMRLEHLQREALAHVDVLDEVDDPHASFAERRFDPIPIREDRPRRERARVREGIRGHRDRVADDDSTSPTPIEQSSVWCDRESPALGVEGLSPRLRWRPLAPTCRTDRGVQLFRQGRPRGRSHTAGEKNGARTQGGTRATDAARRAKHDPSHSPRSQEWLGRTALTFHYRTMLVQS